MTPAGLGDDSELCDDSQVVQRTPGEAAWACCRPGASSLRVRRGRCLASARQPPHSPDFQVAEDLVQGVRWPARPRWSQVLDPITCAGSQGHARSAAIISEDDRLMVGCMQVTAECDAACPARAGGRWASAAGPALVS